MRDRGARNIAIHIRSATRAQIGAGTVRVAARRAGVGGHPGAGSGRSPHRDVAEDRRARHAFEGDGSLGHAPLDADAGSDFRADAVNAHAEADRASRAPPGFCAGSVRRDRANHRIGDGLRRSLAGLLWIVHAGPQRTDASGRDLAPVRRGGVVAGDRRARRRRLGQAS